VANGKSVPVTASVKAERRRPWRISALALGVLASVGGFVDMGGIITSSQAGASFHYALLWTVVPGIVGFAVYAEMSGRIALSSGRATFDVVRERLGKHLSLIPLVALTFVNVLTLVVEISGMALAVRLGLRFLPQPVLVPLMALVLLVLLWRVNFELLDNSAALLGLAMVATVVAAVVLRPPWHDVAAAMVRPSPDEMTPTADYLFAGISLLGAYMTPYQFEFYSSGMREQEEDVRTNWVSAIIGTVFGGLITIALIVVAAQVLYPQHQQVQTLEDAASPTVSALGSTGLALFMLGAFAVSAGAAVEVSLSGAYTVCQYFGWGWGKKPRSREVPLFHLTYFVMFVVAVLVALSGIDPIRLTTVTMALAALSLPFIFGPMLIVANDPDYMGEQRNKLAANVVAMIILALLVVVTVATIPLLVITGGGSS
jgi:Mn2+/Fe2+ NRAMP family transporter